MNLLERMEAAGVIAPPTFLVPNLSYLAVTGSQAYGTSTPTSDYDVYGFIVPPLEMVFPHLTGGVVGFGKHKHGGNRFRHFLASHVVLDEKEYDVTIYNVVDYVQLVAENNPNMLDSLFVPDDCVLVCDDTAKILRDNRRAFLTKKAFHSFKGYAYTQLNKMSKPKLESKRRTVVEEYGYDIKFASHVVRLLLEAEQVLRDKDLDLRKDSAVLREIRAGKWTEEQIRSLFTEKEAVLQRLYEVSDLPWGFEGDQELKIRDLLHDVLATKYGTLDGLVTRTNNENIK